MACEDEEVMHLETQQETTETLQGGFEWVLLSENKNLQESVNQFSLASQTAKGSSLLDDVDFERALTRFDEVQQMTHYTFVMKGEGHSMRRFLLRENLDGEFWGHVLEFEFDKETITSYEQLLGMENFSGTHRLLRLDGTVLREIQMVDGKSVTEKGGANETITSRCSETTTDWYNCSTSPSTSWTCSYTHTTIGYSCSYLPGGSGGNVGSANDSDALMGLDTIGFDGVVSGGYNGNDDPTWTSEEEDIILIPSCLSFEYANGNLVKAAGVF